jgi:hypothetical protein
MLKKPSAQAPEPEDQVKLKPVLGVRPGVYLAAIGAAVILIILFFILLYPGIARPGAMVVFTSEPAGAALRVDDIYAGSSPCRVFVPKGEHIIEAALPGFATERLECTIPSRLFASALFPRRYDLTVTLSAADPAAALAMAAYDYASWTFGGEPTAAWQIPLSLSEGVYRVGGTTSEVNGLLSAAARFAVTRAALRDLVRASTLALNGGSAPSPLTLAQSMSQATAFLSHNAGSAAWLADTLPADSADVLISSAWYQNRLAAFAEVTAGEALAQRSDPSLPVSQIRVGGLLFIGAGSGVLVQGEPFPHRSPVEAFFVCATEVPSPAYADFLDANPRWRAPQREELEKQGLVDSEYLAGFDDSIPAGGRLDTGVTAVSWFAANAFCEWLTGKLPASFSGWEVRLPAEAEWEYAAKSAQKWVGGLAAMEGGAWEWCADPYVPLPFIAAPPEAIAAVGSPERPVRGGSWLNSAVTTNVETRGFLPPVTCSSFVSFRPIIAPSRAAPGLSN